jgi:hypothetical protein
MDQETIAPKRHTPLLKGSLKNVFYPPEKGEYQYFSRARECPFATSGPVVKAAWAADATILAYARYGTELMTDDEFRGNLAAGGLELRAKIGENPSQWNALGTQAYFAAGDGFAILAFRGTDIDDPDNLVHDANFLLVPERDYRSPGKPALGHLSMLLHLFSAPCLVHRGFQAALNVVWDQVSRQLIDYRGECPEAEICISGYSLGGCLALLAYSRLNDSNTSVYTIGGPRLGNTAFRERVAGNIGKGHFRCVNYNDLLVHVPLESALYCHAPQACHRFDEGGSLHSEDAGTLASDLADLGRALTGLPADARGNLRALDELPAPPGVVDHSMARYCMRLWDCT